MKHAAECFTRLVRALLGPGSIAQKKVEWGGSLVVLGVLINMSENGFCLRPAPGKVRRWIEFIRSILIKQHLSPGEASKLAGKLAWGGSQLFYKIGRAQLKP
eukprot:6409325-Karenia_brevis.AAC.1